MKKVIVFILAFVVLSATPVFSQVDTTITKTERIVDKYLDKAENAIKALASALKVPAEHVYSVLVKQQIAVGVCELFGVLIFTLFFLLILRWGFKKKEGERYNNFDDSDGMIALAVILGIISAVFLMTFIIDGLPNLINPEYGAIRHILNLFK